MIDLTLMTSQVGVELVGVGPVHDPVALNLVEALEGAVQDMDAGQPLD